MKSFDVVNTAVIEPILLSAPMAPSKLERLAETCALPTRVTEEQTGLIPLYAAEKFLLTLQRHVGDPMFLFRSLDIEQPTTSETVANVPLPHGVTGLEAVRTLTRNIDRVVTGARFFCEISVSKVWVLRTTNTTPWTDNWPVQQYNLRAVLDGMQRIFGGDMMPVAIRLTSRPHKKEIPDELRGVPIEMASRSFGLAFDLPAIVSAPFPASAQTPSNTRSRVLDVDGVTLDSLKTCISRYVGATGTKGLAQHVARAFGMSARSYRRHLSRLGVSHSRLVSDARLDKALTMIRDPSVSVTRIAFELGYSHPGDFARFFSGRLGTSPSDYRKALQQ
jgi:AraC-like DNA-binding protein